jgi:hypothetical protein
MARSIARKAFGLDYGLGAGVGKPPIDALHLISNAPAILPNGSSLGVSVQISTSPVMESTRHAMEFPFVSDVAEISYRSINRAPRIESPTISALKMMASRLVIGESQ